MTADLARRRSLLTAALGFALYGSAPPETEALRKWLDNRQGVGHVVTGMNRQGYMLHLSNVDASTWRASFSSAPMLSHDGFGVRPTPFDNLSPAAVQSPAKSRAVQPESFFDSVASDLEAYS